MQKQKHSTTEILKALKTFQDTERRNSLQNFFKTHKGGYGEGDKFLGLRVPQIRQLAAKFKQAHSDTLINLLHSKWHEARQLALFILTKQYAAGNETSRAKIYNLYIHNRKHINNWDLIDGSAPHIVGKHLLHRDKTPLHKLIESDNLWDKRIALLATLEFIRNEKFQDTLRFAEQVLTDKHDLIHKASGWMLREIGNRNVQTLRTFLNRFCQIMPRTMLRYSIEKLKPNERKKWLAGGNIKPPNQK